MNANFISFLLVLFLFASPPASAAIDVTLNETYTGTCTTGAMYNYTPESPAANDMWVEFFGPPYTYANLSMSNNLNYSKTSYGSLTSKIYRGNTNVNLNVKCFMPGGYFVRFTRSKDNTQLKIDMRGGHILNAVVNAYDMDGKYVTMTTAWNGQATLFLPPGRYNLEASYGESSVWYNASPKNLAIIVTTPTTGIATIKMPLDPRPTLTTVTKSGNTLTITGTGFGKSRNYVDMGGYVTKLTAEIPSWTDMSITATLPNSVTAGCVRVFSKTGGWSKECLNF
jgi:hypothetical protein